MAIRVISPHSLPFDKLIRAANTGMDAAAEGVRADFYTTTRTWNNVKPRFRITKRGLNRVVSTDNDIYRYLDEGTRVRYVFMTPGFRPKSRAGFIGSGMGRGGFGGFSRKPLPGIKPREFAKTIADKWKRELPRTVQRAIDAAID